ncbi:hypothetical protein CLOP_g12683 [Closterium sp. NIES-67]|nr:hypothetical protein CLOP_g12683 [Closterium sp. NIES-67]
MEGTCWYCKKVGHPWFKCFSRPEGWAPPGMKPPSGERAQGGAVQGSGAQGEGAQEETSCIKDLWQLPIIPWNGKTPTAATAAAGKATAGGDATAPTDGVLEAVKKVQQQQTHGEKLVKDGSLKGLDVKGGVKEIGSCPTCLETKFSKFPFNSATGPAKTPLALVHMDVVGPTRAPSLSGSRYFLTIVDDHTRAVWVYPLKSKGEVAAAVLKEWMPRAQRECGHKVKVIRSDNGGEFIGADFEGELKRKGIQHQLTVPYNPQQNGVAERFNRTLQEGARTLLGRAGLPDPFWVSALRQVALVKNRVLATVGDKEWIPYTKWYGSAPAVNMEKRGKLEASGRWGVHLGIAKDHKGWLLWDLTTQKLTVSRDVKFLESLYYKEWKQQQQKLPSTPLIVEADELQQPSRQVEVAVSEEEMSGVTEEGGAAEVEQQQQQHESPPRVPHPPERPRRDVRPPEKDEILMLLVYVDDILLFSASTALLDSAEQMLEMQFKCSKMGEVKYYLGMHVERDVEKAGSGQEVGPLCERYGISGIGVQWSEAAVAERCCRCEEWRDALELLY